jgi:uncharacterized protein (TIGR00369 family)
MAALSQFYQGEIMDSHRNDEEFISFINELFNENVPFNKVLGLKVKSISSNCVKTSFQMRDELLGNSKRGMLHGGVISSVIDATGGLAVVISVQETMRGETLEVKRKIPNSMSTIDLRIDFLSPGRGKQFVVTAYTLRMGKKVVVIRIELHNDQNDLIAVGTGSYILA